MVHGGAEDEDRDWSKFQSEFDSLMDASEQQLEREQAVVKQLDFAIDQLKQSMMHGLPHHIPQLFLDISDGLVLATSVLVCCRAVGLSI